MGFVPTVLGFAPKSHVGFVRVLMPHQKQDLPQDYFKKRLGVVDRTRFISSELIRVLMSSSKLREVYADMPFIL